jgi:hypothetical protein
MAIAAATTARHVPGAGSDRAASGPIVGINERCNVALVYGRDTCRKHATCKRSSGDKKLSRR